MPRPTTPRRIRFQLGVTYFKPAGVPMRSLEEVSLKFEEAEALRLKDVEGLGQTIAAKKWVFRSQLFLEYFQVQGKKFQMQ